MPMLRRSGGNAVMSTPSKRTRPASGSTKPAIERKVVVLPQPLGPSSDTSSPSPISILRSSIAVVAPNRLVNPPTVTVVIAAASRPPYVANAGSASRHFLVPAIDDRVAVLVCRIPVEHHDLFGPLTIERDQRLQIVWDLGPLVRGRYVEALDPFFLYVGAQQ